MAMTIARGTNISHWLSQSTARGAERRAWFTLDDVKRIADWGFDHIRLPIDEEQMWSEAGTREAEAFDLLDSALRWSHEAGLKVVVDLHILRSHYFNDAGIPALFADPAEKQRFADLWVDLSRFLSHTSTDEVAYELLNEAVAPSADEWNAMSHFALAAVRSQEPARTVVMGSNHFNQFQTYPDFVVPDDDNIILTFHYYNPMFITHYTAKWWRDGGTYTGPIRYPGKPIPDSQHIAIARVNDDGNEWENRHFDVKVMQADMTIPAEIAKREAKLLYCGEFGCYQNTPEDIRQAWYTDIAATFSELGIAWANWDYKGSFGLIDGEGKETGVRGWLMR